MLETNTSTDMDITVYMYMCKPSILNVHKCHPLGCRLYSFRPEVC